MDALLLALTPPAVLVLVGVLSYNRFIAQLAAIDAAWANIEGELQRRHDLVPNLVATVAGYATHEQRTLHAVTSARSQAIAANRPDAPVDEQARAEDALTRGLTSLLAVSERYPQLRSDARFRDLQHQLVETEDRLAAARRLYNLEVAAYERRRRAVPSNVVAWAASLTERTMFEISDPVVAHAPHVPR